MTVGFTFKMTYNTIPEGMDLLKKITEQVAGEAVQQNAIGAMYDMIEATMPFPKGSQSGGGTLDAFNHGFRLYQATVDKAFKPLESRPIGDYVMDRDYDAIIKYNIVWENPYIRKDFEDGNFDAIYEAFQNAGWTKSPYPMNTVDDATIELLHDYRAKFGQNGIKSVSPYDSYNVRNKATITKLRNANNQVKIGFMAGGWLKCAVQLNDKPDKYTQERKPIWMFGKGDGIAIVSTNKLTINCKNSYGNFGGWFKSYGIQLALLKRSEKLKQTFKDSKRIIASRYKSQKK